MTAKPIPPLPRPYTTVPNGLPVGAYMPGMYHSPAYLEWERKYGSLFTKKAASDVEVTLATNTRDCDVCKKPLPRNARSNQLTHPGECQTDHKRVLNRAKDKRRYKARPLEMRTCDYCKREYNPTKFTQATCGDAKCQAARQRARRDVA